MVFCKAPDISPSRTETMSSNNAIPTPTASDESRERVLFRPTLRYANLNAWFIIIFLRPDRFRDRFPIRTFVHAKKPNYHVSYKTCQVYSLYVMQRLRRLPSGCD